MLRCWKKHNNVKPKCVKSTDTYFSITSIPDDDEANSAHSKKKRLMQCNASFDKLVKKSENKKKVKKLKNQKLRNHKVEVRNDEKEPIFNKLIFKENLSLLSDKRFTLPLAKMQHSSKSRNKKVFHAHFTKIKDSNKKLALAGGDRHCNEYIKMIREDSRESFPINWTPTVQARVLGQVAALSRNQNEYIKKNTKRISNEVDNTNLIPYYNKLHSETFCKSYTKLKNNEEIKSVAEVKNNLENELTTSTLNHKETSDTSQNVLLNEDSFGKIEDTVSHCSTTLMNNAINANAPQNEVDDQDIYLKKNRKTVNFAPVAIKNKKIVNYQEFKLVRDDKNCCLPSFCARIFKMKNSVVLCNTKTVFTRKVSKFFKRTPSESKFGLLLPPNRSPLKLLMVFLQPDAVSDTLSRAADKLGFDVTTSNSYEGTLEEFVSKLHDLIVIDARCPQRILDCDTLCRSIRNTRGSQHTAAVALVKKSAFDKDDVTVTTLLDSGFNRCIVETTNIIHYVNELVQLKQSDIRPLAQYATNQSLYVALEKCNDIVLVTDDSFRLQYANRASERFLGYRYEETLGKTLQEQLIYDPIQLNSMSSSLMRAREWQGPITLRRKGQDAITFTCKATPIISAGRSPTHFAMVIDIHGLSETPSTFDKPRGSVQSLRRTSLDVRSVGSDYLRRTSLAKLSALPLEAPITKVITLLTQAQEQTTPSVVGILDKVIDLLQNSELYSPHLKDDLRLRCDEPVTSDLITALLMQQPQLHTSASSRRSSNDSTTLRSAHRTVSKIRVPTQIKELLETSLTWEFDIFRLEDLTNKKPLTHLGMNLFLHFDVPQTLNCKEKTLFNWLTVIEMNYHMDNSYHNSTHAADVMQATAGFLEKDRLKAIMDPLDEATSLLAACAHDIDHPGKSSAFLSNCDNPLAILYNDSTVLENHHAALTFKLTLGDDRINIFKNLDRETYKIARHNVIDMILATEMTKHFEHLAKFVNVFCPKSTRSDECENSIPITLPENITLVKRMMIKCADVSNPTRPLRLCVEWARRIAEEYFAQTDEEKLRGLPVVMPMFDRITCSIPKSQIGFVDYIVHDMFEAWDAFIDMPELVSYMRQNYIRWKEFDEQGHTTAADIRKLQNNLIMAPMFPSKSTTKRNE